MTGDVVGWAVTGLVTSVLAPGLLLATRGQINWDRLGLPAAAALPGFVVVHAAITLALAQRPPALVWLLLHVPLLIGALIYWLPIYSPARRLSDPLRVVYLFLSTPPLELAGVIVIVLGDQAGGLAMITAMLPAGLIAVGVTWQWIHHEERSISLDLR